MSTWEAGQETVRSRVPLPRSGVTVMASSVVAPVCTSALPEPWPMRVPSELRALTVTVQVPKARVEMVSEPSEVDWEKEAPSGPEPLTDQEATSMLMEGSRVRETWSAKVMVIEPEAAGVTSGMGHPTSSRRQRAATPGT